MKVVDAPIHRNTPSLEIRKKCLDMVLKASEIHGIPAPVLVGRYGGPEAGKVRRSLQAAMVMELGMRRWQVAYMFNCDIRRCKSSVLGIPHSDYQGRGKLVKLPYKRRVSFSPTLLVPIGNQLFWSACVPAELPASRATPTMRPLSDKAISRLDASGRAEVIRFLEAQMSRVKEGL